MKLLVVTQKADKDDENLGAFYHWFEVMARKVEQLTIIADAVGSADFPENVTVYGLGKDQKKGRFARFAKYHELFSYYYARSDAVFFHQIPEFVIAAFPYLLSLRKRTSLWYAHGSVSRRLLWAERFVDDIFTSSAAGFRLPSKKIHYVGQAIHTDLFCPANGRQGSRAGVHIISVGRIAPVKNYDILIRACALLKNSFKESWTLSFVGGPILDRDKTYLKFLKMLVAENNLAPHVSFYGAQKYSDIPQTLRDHDIFVNLSNTGSLDKAVFEAMSTGLTVITSNEAYRPVLNDRYFLPRATPECVAERIQSLWHDARPNITLRDAVVRDHGLENTIDKILSILSARR